MYMIQIKVREKKTSLFDDTFIIWGQKTRMEGAQCFADILSDKVL